MRDSGKGPATVIVHNADGVNPYATELAALLASEGHVVTLVDASNGVHRPPSAVTWRTLLPANFGSEGKPRQLVRLARGLGCTLWSAVVRGDVVIVASVRLPIENLALAALAAIGLPVVHVQHDPVRRRAESWISAWSRRQVLLRSTVAVVHSNRLRDELDPAALDHVVVCPHPPYCVTARQRMTGARHGRDGRRWLAFIGALRPDKGIHLVPEILSRIPQADRSRLGLVICGHGQVGPQTCQQIADLGVVVIDMTSTKPVEHERVLDILADGPLVLAPYVSATQSGSVILALTMGCSVLAFDKGGIRDVLTDEGLVPNGDIGAFAAAVATGRSGTSRVPIDVWATTAAKAWSSAVEQACARSVSSARSPRRGPKPDVAAVADQSVGTRHSCP